MAKRKIVYICVATQLVDKDSVANCNFVKIPSKSAKYPEISQKIPIFPVNSSQFLYNGLIYPRALYADMCFMLQKRNLT